MSHNDESQLEKLGKALYSRAGGNIIGHKKRTWSTHTTDVQQGWKHAPEDLPQFEPEEENPHASSSLLKKILLGAVIFFVASVGLSAYILFRGSNLVSADNVDIIIKGPVSIAGGEALTLDVAVLNKNNTKLEFVDISVDYPVGTANPQNVGEEMRRYREAVGDINAGQTVTKKMSSILFGEQNSKKEIKFLVEYRVTGSNAIFYKEKSYDIFLSSSPLTLTIDSLKEVNARQETEFTLTLTSNSTNVMKNLLFRATYPFGFKFTRSDPKATFENNAWKLGDLPPGGKRTIKIAGTLEGQDEEERTFHFEVGNQNAKNEKFIGTPFIASEQTVMIKKPFVTLALAFDGATAQEDYVAEFGNPVRVDVSWINNLSDPINDAIITVKLAGSIINKNQIDVDRGFYNSVNDTIVWDKRSVAELTEVRPGQTGKVSFTFTPSDPSVQAGRLIQNPEGSVDASVKANRVAESRVPESLSSSVDRKIKIASRPSLLAQTFHYTGLIPNAGPIPPKAEQETTYTLVWTVTNTSSNIAHATVKTVLPTYVKWTGVILPAGETVSYNPVGGEVTWDIGDIPAGAGIQTPRKEVSFQVSLTPSVSQVGTVPALTQEIVLEGEDRFTGTQLKLTRAGMTTRLTSDSGAKDGDERVVR